MHQEPAARIVVGDRFEEFLTHPGTEPVSEVLGRLRSGALPRTTPLVPGQGLSAGQLRELGELTGADLPLPSDRGPTHKHHDRNVLIGEVRQDGPDDYAAPLLLDQRVEVLEDHLTGQHIPAVTLLEAARQTWTAVSERFLLPDREPRRFVIGTIRFGFHSFVFPLPATVGLRLRGRQHGPVGISFDFAVTITQGDRTAAECEATVRAVPEAVAVKQESMAARQAIRAALTAAPVPAAAP
ncbi:AfsA-related hotdog domain-containing protein [Streptomyces sp. CSDS2]|uniref:AfsA-related hotdog domain-containing protein n=1 Tax=Streptomyces sp. CSDS2 TaxID=3055051 RepID=UPI0025AF586D|nr:AfsA-related hotdog domain-containing protein [Streptomyces sp. CSDS2]MDN3260900.1 AfsA-related hotdog domain-containing protein [Streptomyces sp. CSDS2]